MAASKGLLCSRFNIVDIHRSDLQREKMIYPSSRFHGNASSCAARLGAGGEGTRSCPAAPRPRRFCQVWNLATGRVAAEGT